jgi:hypothetical protein
MRYEDWIRYEEARLARKRALETLWEKPEKWTVRRGLVLAGRFRRLRAARKRPPVRISP